MSTFPFGADEDKASIVAGLNYLLANQAQQSGLIADNATGQIIDPVTRTTVQYLYEYINVRYADSSDGTLNFSTSPTNRTWYGLRNTSTATGSSNPADYVWYETANGFGIYSFLFYLTNGGRQIQWVVNDAAPNNSWVQVLDNTPIDLDIVTTATTQSIVTLNIYIRSATTPPIPSGGVYDFSSLVLTPPVGWSASIPSGTNPIWISTNVFTNPASGQTAGPSNVWTYPVIVAQNGSARSTYNMIAYVREPSQPVTPTAGTGSWNFTTNTGTPPTGADGSPWELSVPSGNVQLWASTAVVSIIGSSGVATPSSWTTPAELSGTGAGGISTLVAFARVAGNPVPVTGQIITNGTTYPTTAESLATWGFNATWVAEDPNPASTNSLYQTSGSFDPSVGQTVWTTPYIVSLQTSTLSSITPALGTVTSGTVGGNIVINTTGNISANRITSVSDIVSGNISGNNITGNSFSMGLWDIFLSPTNGLLFQYNNANLMVLNTDGNLTVSGNVIQNGTVI